MWTERTSNVRRPSVTSKVSGGVAAAAVRIRDRVAPSGVAPTSTPGPARTGALEAFAYVIRPSSVIRMTGLGFWPGKRLIAAISRSRRAVVTALLRRSRRTAVALDASGPRNGTTYVTALGSAAPGRIVPAWIASPW